MDGNGMNKSQHVVPNRDGNWAVRRSGSSKASRVFPTQKDAVHYARETARKEGAEMYIHRNDGTVTGRESYRSDSSESPRKR
jgi:hypothetical protein